MGTALIFDLSGTGCHCPPCLVLLGFYEKRYCHIVPHQLISSMKLAMRVKTKKVQKMYEEIQGIAGTIQMVARLIHSHRLDCTAKTCHRDQHHLPEGVYGTSDSNSSKKDNNYLNLRLSCHL